jgi:hypothetical protein
MVDETASLGSMSGTIRVVSPGFVDRCENTPAAAVGLTP